MEKIPYFYELAKISANKAAEQGINVDPQWIYAQWYQETGGFTSNWQATDHNLGGLYDASGGVMHFDSFIDFANYFGQYLSYYKEDGIAQATNLYSYLAALQHGGYFTADLNSYYMACLEILNLTTF